MANEPKPQRAKRTKAEALEELKRQLLQERAERERRAAAGVSSDGE